MFSNHLTNSFLSCAFEVVDSGPISMSSVFSIMILKLKVVMVVSLTVCFGDNLLMRICARSRSMPSYLLSISKVEPQNFWF